MKKHLIAIPFLLFFFLQQILFISFCQAQSEDDLSDIHKDIENLQKGLIPSRTTKTFTVNGKRSGGILITGISFDQCLVTIEKNQTLQEAPQESLESLLGNGSILALGRETIPRSIEDENWGPGIQLGDNPAYQLFFPDNSIRNSFLGKLKKINQKCIEKKQMLKDFAQKRILSNGKGDFQACDPDEMTLPKSIAYDDLEFIREFVLKTQGQKFDQVLSQFLKQFPVDDSGIPLDPNIQGPQYAKSGLEILEFLQQDPSLIDQIPLPTLAGIFRNMMATGAQPSVVGESFPSPSLLLLKVILGIMYDQKGKIQDYLARAGLENDVLLRGGKIRGQLNLGEVQAFFEREGLILELDNHRKKKNGENLIAEGSLRRLKWLSESAGEILPPGNIQAILQKMKVSGKEGTTLLQDEIRRVLNEVKKENLNELLEVFHQNFNIFRKKRGPESSQSSSDNEDDREQRKLQKEKAERHLVEFEKLFLKIMSYLNDNPQLVPALDTATVVELIRVGNLNSGGDEQMGNAILNFYQDHVDVLSSLLMKEDGLQNIRLLENLSPGNKLSAEEFFNFIKKENDILWTVMVRDQDIKSNLKLLKDEDPGKYQSYQMVEETFKENFSTLVKASRFRLGLMLKQYIKDNSAVWKDEIAFARKENNGNPDRDFEHYGRFGVVGNTLEDMIKYQRKLEVKKEWEDRKITHEILVGAVFDNLTLFPTFYKILEFASGLSLGKTTALGEISRIDSEIQD